MIELGERGSGTVRGLLVGAGLVCVCLFLGCGHKGEVEDLIETKYAAAIAEGGSMKISDYKEWYRTKWYVRTYYAEGKVKWRKPWYLVLKTLPASAEVPEIVVVDPYKRLNEEGVTFDAVIYRGRTDLTSDVNIHFDTRDKYTEKGLQKRYADKVVLTMAGESLCKKFDKKGFAACGAAVQKRAEERIAQLVTTREKNAGRVEKFLALDSACLDDSALDACVKEGGELHVALGDTTKGTDKLYTSIAYFNTFPVEALRPKGLAGIDKKIEAEIAKTEDVMKCVLKQYELLRLANERRARRRPRR